MDATLPYGHKRFDTAPLALLNKGTSTQSIATLITPDLGAPKEPPAGTEILNERWRGIRFLDVLATSFGWQRPGACLFVAPRPSPDGRARCGSATLPSTRDDISVFFFHFNSTRVSIPHIFPPRSFLLFSAF